MTSLKLEYEYSELKPLKTNKLRIKCSSHKLCGAGSRKTDEQYIRHLLCRTQYVEQIQLTQDWETIKSMNVINRRKYFEKYDPKNTLQINRCDDTYYRFVCNTCRSQIESKIIIESSSVFKCYHQSWNKCKCPHARMYVDMEKVTMIKYQDWTWPKQMISVEKLERIKKDGSIEIIVTKKRRSTEIITCPLGKKTRVASTPSNDDERKPTLPRVETEPLTDDDIDESGDNKNNDNNKNNNDNNNTDVREFSFEELYVHKEIGSGTFGQIFKCSHSKTGQMFAIKVLEKDEKVLKNDATEDPALREVKLMRQFKGNAMKNIIQIVDSITMKKCVHIAMEYMDCDLKQYLSLIGIKTLPHSTKKLIARKVSGHMVPAIHSMHRKATAHCDIKPANILINFQSKSIKLGDLGSATTIKEFKSCTKIRYSPGYYPQIDDVDIRQKRSNYDITKMDSYCYGMTMVDILMPEMSPTTFMGSIDRSAQYAVFVIESMQQRAYKYTGMAEYQTQYGDVMEILSRCITPSHEQRSRVTDLLEMEYIKDAITNSGKLQLPPLRASTTSTPKISPQKYTNFFKW